MSKFKSLGAFVKKVKLHSAKAYQDSKKATKSAVSDLKEGYNSIEKLEDKVIEAEIVSKR